MNILPKKNWHVRKKENIARVRKDEAEALEKEKEQERRQKLAEQEARIAFLRQRVRGEKNETDPKGNETTVLSQGEPKDNGDIYTSSGNINFFKDVEAGKSTTGTNKEYEEEKKIEKETYEKKIGLLNYLCQDPLEASGKSSWYANSTHVISKSETAGFKGAEDEVSLKSKVEMDPIREIMKHTKKKNVPNLVGSFNRNIILKSDPHLPLKSEREAKRRHSKSKRKHDLKTDSKRKKKKKYSSKKKRKRETNSESEEEEDLEAKQAQLAKLRKERLKREAEEQKRAAILLAKNNPEEPKPKLTPTEVAFKQKYNSQFNPHLAKQNQSSMSTSQEPLKAGVKYWMV